MKPLKKLTKKEQRMWNQLELRAELHFLLQIARSADELEDWMLRKVGFVDGAAVRIVAKNKKDKERLVILLDQLHDALEPFRTKMAQRQ